MVNRDQLEQTPEGQQVLAFMDEHFTFEQFQPALTLIEQHYTEDQIVWDAELNNGGNHPFTRNNPAQRLLVFFAAPHLVQTIKAELEQRAAAAAIEAAQSAALAPRAPAKPKKKKPLKAKPKLKRKPKQKPRRTPSKKRPSRKRRAPAAQKTRAKGKR